MNTFIRGTLERRNDFRQEAMKTESVRKLVKEGNVRELDEFLDEDEEIDTIDPDTEGDEWFNSSSSRGIWDIGEGKIEVHNSNVAKIEGDTCWNGVLKGVQSTLTFKEAIISFTDRYDSEKGQTKGRINLSEKICLQDWECLGEVGTILKTIDDCTIPYMDNVVDLPMVMSLLYWLRGHFLEYYSVFSISDSTLDSETDPEDCYSIPTSQAASQQSLHTPTQRGMKRKKSIDGPHEEVAVDIDTRQKKKTSAERKNDVGEQGRDDIHDGLRRVNNVLQEYWDMFNGMPAYWAAVVLDPSKRLKKLQIKGPQLAKEIKEKVLAYWRSHYADPATLTKSNAEAVTSSSQLHSPKKFAWLSHYDSPDSDSEDEDELEYYLNMEKTGFKRGQEPLLWWRDHQTEFPRLHQFALDILSIPSTSMKCKRILKQSESAMFESRRTEYNMLEITQCLKSWLEEVEE
ncbi:transposase [Daldinia childiae]|uniref:transposase n=1 Tax=Daldinia childiae TaxID=326645 RepID=UPI00144669EF|nr:transposase [Daldinia childiae]KAF3069061.1 transposase [Daldinia childiae]